MHTRVVVGCTCVLCERERVRSAVPSALENAASIQLISAWRGSMSRRRADGPAPIVESSYLFAETTPASISDSYYKPTTGQQENTPSGIADGRPGMTSFSTSARPSHKTGLPTEAAARKNLPLYSGVMRYFPDALTAIAAVSKAGNDQHNPGQPLHWSRGKSGDHHDCLARHLLESGTVDSDGHRHSAKAAWRALAILQLEIEAERADG